MPVLVIAQARISFPLHSGSLTHPVFRLARCIDLIEARCAHPELLFSREDFDVAPADPATPAGAMDPLSHYTIKQMGSFFCGQQIQARDPGRLLEVGAGFGAFFARRFADNWDYWAIDEPGFYDADKLERGRKRRPEHTFIEGLMGEDNDLPDTAFDVVTSVSVLEHVEYSAIYDVCRDLRRVTRPGGINVHSIDVTPQTTKTRGQRWLHGMLDAGFDLIGEVGIDWWQYDVPPEREILVEPLMLVYEVMGGATARQFSEPVVRPYTMGTILALFRAR